MEKTVLNLETGVVETVALDDADIAQADADKAAAEAAAPRLAILAQIRELENSITDRRWREAGPDDAGGTAAGRAWLKGISDQIAALRASL